MTLFIVCIIGEKARDKWTEKTEPGDSFSLEWEGKTYSGTIRDSWFKKYGPIGRFIHGEPGEHLVMFHQGKNEPIIHGDPPNNSAHRLMRAHRYKGVNPALKDQFAERSALDLPWWAIVIGLAVFIVGFLIIANKQGWLTEIFK